MLHQLPKPSSDSVVIVGSGPSLTNFDFDKLDGFETIVANTAVFYVNNPTHFVTVDYTFFSARGYSIHDVNKRVDSSFFIVPPIVDVLPNGNYIHTEFNLEYSDLVHFDHILKSSESIKVLPFEMSTDDLLVSDSGTATLQIATLMGYKNIYMIGFDLRMPGCFFNRVESITSEQTKHRNSLISYVKEYNKRSEEFNIHVVDGLNTFHDDDDEIHSFKLF